MADQMKQTNINGKIVGVLEEKALEFKEGEKKEKDGVKYTTDIIQGKLVVDGYEIRVYAQSKTAKGDNNMFKGIKTIYNDYVDKIMAAKDSSLTADTISASIKYECNDYVDKVTGEVKTGVQLSLSKANRVSPETPNQAEVDINGAVIRTIVPEMKDEEETGRLKLEIATFDYYGKLKPFMLYVENGSEEDGLDTLVEDFKETFEAGQTVRLYAELIKKQMGGEQKTDKKPAFGKKVDVASGYTVIETCVIGGEEPFDEEASYNLDDVKKAMNQREEELEQLKKKEKDKANKPSSSGGLKGSGKGNKPSATGGIGNKKPQEEEDDSPF